MLFFANPVFAQQSFTCGNELVEIPDLPESSPPTPCFDVDEVFENCTPVWIRVNVHFFIGDNCQGSIDPLTPGINSDLAFYWAKKLIDEANERLELNYPQWAMLDTINLRDDYCNRIAQIGGECPPTAPFAGIVHGIELRCSFCIFLSGSGNESDYNLEIYKPVGGDEDLIFSSGWQQGLVPDKYCISTMLADPSDDVWTSGFAPNTDYRLYLTTKNSCGDEKTFTLDFTTPDTNCDESGGVHPPIAISVSPNPVVDEGEISYELFEEKDVKIFAVHPVYGKYAGEIEDITNQQPGVYEKTISTADWYEGLNVLMFQVDENIYSITIVKQQP